MNQQQNSPHRGTVIAVSALAGLAAALLGVVGVVSDGAVTAQQFDVTLTNAADDAHSALIDAQVLLNQNLFAQQIALQQSIYYWVDQNITGDVNKLLFVDPDAIPLSTNIFNGAFTRFSESLVVAQAIQQVQWDHLLGVNQTLGVGGYEEAIGQALYNDLSGSGIAPASDLGQALSALTDSTIQDSYSGFHGALTDLQNQLLQTAWNDMLGMFSVGAPSAAASAFDLFDPSTWL